MCFMQSPSGLSWIMPFITQDIFTQDKYSRICMSISAQITHKCCIICVYNLERFMESRHNCLVLGFIVKKLYS